MERKSSRFQKGQLLPLLVLLLLTCSVKLAILTSESGHQSSSALTQSSSISSVSSESRSSLAQQSSSVNPSCNYTPFNGEFDLDKLSLAVATQESSNCTKGVATWSNNCHGIMKRGGENPVIYENTAASHTAFKDLWTRVYGGYPDIKKAQKYNNRAGGCHWLQSVAKIYNSL